MSSDYNRAHERLLAADLGVEEWRLGIALVRALLGFRKRGGYRGERLLREQARLDGRSLTRARDGLVVKKLIRYSPPASSGRGHRGYYELLRDEEMPAPTRDFPGESETPAPEREIRETPAETPAPTRARSKEENYVKALCEERLEEDRSELRRETDDEKLIALALTLNSGNEKREEPPRFEPPVSRLERLRQIGAQPPAGEQAILAELDELLPPPISPPPSASASRTMRAGDPSLYPPPEGSAPPPGSSPDGTMRAHEAEPPPDSPPPGLPLSNLDPGGTPRACEVGP